MQGARERGQSGQKAGRQRGARRGCNARDKRRTGQFVVDQQHHGRSQQIGHLGRLLPPLREAQMQRLAPLPGTEGIGQLTDQALALVVQHPGQASAGGMPDGRQPGQRSEGSDPPGLARAPSAPRTRSRRPGRRPTTAGPRLPGWPSRARLTASSPAVVRAAPKERTQRRRNAGLRAEQRVGGQRLVLAAGLLALGQARDVLGAVQAAARIGRVGHDFQLAAAHVGVDRLGLHPEDAARLVHRHPGSHGLKKVYILILYVNLD